MGSRHCRPRITAVSVTVLASTVLFTEVIIGVLLYRNGAIPDMLKRETTMSIRILVFTLLGGATFAVALVFSVTRTRGVEFDLVIAVLPPTSAIIFSTQSDLFCVFWCRDPHASPVDEDPSASVSLTTIHSVQRDQASYVRANGSQSTRQERSFRSDRGTISSREPDDGLESVALSLSIPASPVTPNLTPKTPIRVMVTPASPKSMPQKSPYSGYPSFLKF
ncbi:hypothetical protein CVT24_010268 [Panaeolus cyanescens]|uniref:Uncharacterized protein n=1 Tax=Panaeolus cyanescens TaxID=181874 RepID=A0A409YQ04_9AGAR|nr:hypothetical protein CVT24_010268 [Panaeolus cyanescens]